MHRTARIEFDRSFRRFGARPVIPRSRAELGDGEAIGRRTVEKYGGASAITATYDTALRSGDERLGSRPRPVIRAVDRTPGFTVSHRQSGLMGACFGRMA